MQVLDAKVAVRLPFGGRAAFMPPLIKLIIIILLDFSAESDD